MNSLTTAKAIRKLESQSLVWRKRSKIDSRATNVRFSVKGRKLIQEAIVAIEAADEDFFSGLNEMQLEEFKSLTSKVISNNEL
jgi:DNA-binding MarR family transcriptional regulator